MTLRGDGGIAAGNTEELCPASRPHPHCIHGQPLVPAEPADAEATTNSTSDEMRKLSV